ncbi:hypothetical protein [Roseivivax sediminis]|uniref:Sulfotransferase domain-containing protein n=1 Tax=Roseivivax sediminis TaxID=936889 RepID=A0A1I2AC14_9RHOB|nr:hypothetical protein [Roseivivax sediminis]SFE41555.1 hypothetical protein SAMN04515678_109176 [Roseivivax sediminis]
MSRRIVLHVGSPKCGSTYLQRVMLQNADTLLAHGIRYPHGGQTHPGNAGDTENWTQTDYDALFEGGIETVLLSHEDLYSKPNFAKPLLKAAEAEGAQVQVVVFLRPFSDFLFGDYSQFMKQNFWRYLETRNPYDGESFRDVIDRRLRRLKPARFLRNWQSAVRGTRVRVAGHRDIRATMEDLLGPLPLDWTVERHATNPSLRMEDCERIADALRRPWVPREVIEQMYRDAFHKVDRPDAGRSAARRRVIETLFAEENALILKQYGYDNRLPDADIATLQPS